MLAGAQVGKEVRNKGVIMEVCILDTQDLFKAQFAKSKLENNNIFCELRTNDAGGTLPHLRNAQGAKLYVTEKDKERALKILNAQI